MRYRLMKHCNFLTYYRLHYNYSFAKQNVLIYLSKDSLHLWNKSFGWTSHVLLCRDDTAFPVSFVDNGIEWESLGSTSIFRTRPMRMAQAGEASAWTALPPFMRHVANSSIQRMDDFTEDCGQTFPMWLRLFWNPLFSPSSTTIP